LKFDGPNAAEFRFNSEWLAKMSFADVVELASHFTVQQMMERDMFEKRMEEGKPIHLHEFMYPLMQGYDSVAMDVDLELGGNDQTFNMLAGRTLMRSMKGKEKFVVTNRLLVDPSGKKMGKSEGNMLSFLDSPEDMYGKVMSWTDGMIVPAWEIFTTMGQDLPDGSIATADGLSESYKEMIGQDPYAAKRRLAHQIVYEMMGGDRSSDSRDLADKAADHFTRVHSQGETPEEVPEMQLPQALSLVDILVKAELVDSKTEARRQIEQGGVKVDDVVVNDVKAVVEPTEAGVMIQKGKRFFVKVVKA
jgi:tyrosyl-tRNA synthetase